MKRTSLLSAVILLCLSGSVAAALDAWCPHVTAAGGWKTGISLFNPGNAAVDVSVARYGTDGSPSGAPITLSAAPRSWTAVTPADLAFEGTAHLSAPSDLEVKLSYQQGSTEDVCEFFLTGEAVRSWVLPNTVRSWMAYTGIALMNPLSSPVAVTLEAWLNGSLVATNTVVVSGGQQYIRLSNEIWPGLSYDGLDTVQIYAAVPIPAPLDITGNVAGDRHLFFSARNVRTPGELEETDPILGNLVYVPSGKFTQGSPVSEACRNASVEVQFPHTLTKRLAVMETEVTRQMWADLKAVQPTLPADMTDTAISPGMTCPVQKIQWYEAVLFANLLSVQRGLIQCYYVDAAFTDPITALNHTGPVYCNWEAGGFRLPTEGEWEYICRAGTTTAFWVTEPLYGTTTCSTCSPSPALTAFNLSAWWCANSTNQTQPVGHLNANPWNLREVHGNVWEWCWDRFANDYPAGAQTDYRGPDTGTARVVRGGAWNSDATSCRSAGRGLITPLGRENYCGFRLVRKD
ncbi:MAG: formylglycine-generating enzyme family protein [Acidobacteria bacterium]|nr:formylglycine-generating enzyme family protein [Acidobacteriota bacterium]